ncbi:5-oxoprolinase subunit PxpB [Sporosarcina psychrophila]|uniref:5-oxoprolinase subunit PxpB n=1 Tax=Sporosarcina psychrophila TaxID=1476 RepID=UPI0030D04762
MNPNKQIIPRAMVMNEQTIRFDFGPETSREIYHTIQQFCQVVECDRNHLLEEVVPSNKTVTVFFRKELVNPSVIIEQLLKKWVNRTDSILSVNTRTIEIPVCYDTMFSEDIPRICNHTGLTREEVIAIHTGTSYKVYMIGFLPGFPYLGELPEILHVPRLEKPRLSVPKGTVGIGGAQTGIYPIESPGGWNIIGRTPLDLYCLKRVEPFLIRAGDQLKFRSISLETFNEMKEELARAPEMIMQFVKEGL